MAGLIFLNESFSAEKIKICFIFEYLEGSIKSGGENKDISLRRGWDLSMLRIEVWAN